MRFMMQAFVVFVCVLATHPALAQSPLRYKLVGEGSHLNRYLGSEELGQINSGSFRLYADDLRHARRFALEYENDQNDVDSAHGLELTEESVDLAVSLPLQGSGTDINVAASLARYNISEDFWAIGIYPVRDGKHHRYSASLERDADDNVHLDGTLISHYEMTSVLAGVSHERYQPGRGDDEWRFALGWESRYSRPQVLGYFGLTGNPDDAPTWTLGAARYASTTSEGLNPAAILVWREKPESHYVLGIATLWGRALSEHSCPGMFRSFFQGSLSKSRVVRNREFGTLGVGRGYDQVDFGLVSLSGTELAIDVTPGVQLRQSEYAVVASLPDTYGPFARPFLGLTYDKSSDLVFSYRDFRLIDPEQEWTTLSVGASFLIGKPVERYRNGNYLRIQFDMRFSGSFDGALLKATYWR